MKNINKNNRFNRKNVKSIVIVLLFLVVVVIIGVIFRYAAMDNTRQEGIKDAFDDMSNITTQSEVSN